MNLGFNYVPPIFFPRPGRLSVECTVLKPVLCTAVVPRNRVDMIFSVRSKYVCIYG
jgi:hypothetical protein